MVLMVIVLILSYEAGHLKIRYRPKNETDLVLHCSDALKKNAESDVIWKV